MGDVLITGASAGIGKEFAKVFAENKYDLILVARRKEKLEEIKREIEEKYAVKVNILSKDLSKENASREIYGELKDKEVEILVNNAGFGDYGPFMEGNDKKQKDMIMLNVLALTEMTKLFGQDMKSRGKGKILNVASTAAFIPGPNMAEYFATKAYVLHFSEALADELKDSGVSVTTLCPGATSSEFQDVASLNESKFVKQSMASSREVAEFGYQQMMKGKTVAVHGFKNKMMIFPSRVMPRKMVVSMVKKMMSK